jgi:serine/threonine protein kinase
VGKVADFGSMKRNFENKAEEIITQIAGTTGYIDPEYYTNGKVTRKSDVYRFHLNVLTTISFEILLQLFIIT